MNIERPFNLAKLMSLSSLLAVSTLSFEAHSATKHVRLSWDSDPAHNAVIGFSPDGTSNSPYVKYGTDTNESSWSSQSVSQSTTFGGSLDSHFVRLNNLSAHSAVYFRVCDQDGCGDRFWFQTAPADDSPFIVAAGGDTRTGWTNRQKGNTLISKLRPLFIMHGGDFTDSNNASQMKAWLDDWTLTYSSDQINGLSYNRIYPLIPTHGNHEDGNYSTICQVFGVDSSATNNQDGQCNPYDTYSAFNISPLLRVYTLNSQFKDSGWGAYATAMNNWLESDLANNGSSAKWRFAQYHKPMFPHYTGKSDNQILFDWWAQEFYDDAMNLVVESDTHITKVTKALLPSGNQFSETTSGGTVYVGEGSWGAPARSANDPKSWTIDLASIQQFKVISVTKDALEVRTAQFDASASTLSRADRQSDPLLLPSNVNWWSANQIGEVMQLERNSSQRTVITNGGGGNGGDFISLAVTDDVFISSNNSNTNYNGDSDGLLADGSSSLGELETLIKFDLSSIPDCAVTAEAQLTFNVTDRSTGSYNLYFGLGDWAENSATWNSVGGSNQHGTLVTIFTPSSTGLMTLNLSSANVLEHWLNNGNYGFVIASAGTTNGVDMDSKETGMSPVLKVKLEENDSCGGGGEPEGGSFARLNQTGNKGDWLHFNVDIPAGMNTLNVTINGGTGDGDLYVRKGQEPTLNSYDCRPWLNGNSETCKVNNPEAGTWFFSLQGYGDFDGINLNASWAP